MVPYRVQIYEEVELLDDLLKEVIRKLIADGAIFLAGHDAVEILVVDVFAAAGEAEHADTNSQIVRGAHPASATSSVRCIPLLQLKAEYIHHGHSHNGTSQRFDLLG